MKKLLFLIHDLGPGGAEKVLVNLVNNMDFSIYDVTVMTIFDVGVNKQYLDKRIHYKTIFKRVFRGNSHIMKLFSARKLHDMLIKDFYDIEISYLEGPCARIISGCSNKNTKIMTWIHREQFNSRIAAASFRSVKEAERCYNRFNRIICVSETVKRDFCQCLELNVPLQVLYNTNETEKILKLSSEPIEEIEISSSRINIVGVGKLLKSKGFDRIIRITKMLIDEGFPVTTYLLGNGPEESELEKIAVDLNVENQIVFLGYQLNPYKFVRNCDLFVCASFAEGFSTAATEALIVGTPVCTVEVSGMKEMLGDNNEYGIVTENDDNSLYLAIKKLISDKKLLADYKSKAKIRGNDFKTEETVKAVQHVFDTI